MTITDAPVATPARRGPRRRYSEQLHTLVDTQTREYILGMASMAAAEGGYATPREAEETRALLDEAIALRYEADPKAYVVAVEAGRALVAERAWNAAYKDAKAGGASDLIARRQASKIVPGHTPKTGAQHVAAAGGRPQA